ncbi:MAG: hypothetical protein IJR48_03135 [Oscillibacter sp.]|nr:hypothetical protein [Oscillibacter sp.]
MKKRFLTVCLALGLCLSVLTGCGGGGGTTDTGAASKAVKASGNAVTVESMEEFLEAVKPGAEIVIAGGFYNLSDYVNDIWETDEAESFNGQHEYVEIDDCYDGAEAVIKNADNLTILGSESEIVIDPRYGTVLTFEHCDNLKVSGLTLGHTETGECSGSVLELSACKNAELRGLDLYGCGVIALECSDGTEDVTVYDSALRDCSWGPLDVYGATGRIELHNCSLTGSDGGGSYNAESRLQLGFYNCVFGPWETNFWAFTEGVEFEDCTWDEITEYPDYEEDYEGETEITFSPESMTATAADLTSNDTFWVGYSTLNTDTGEAGDIPSGVDATDVYMNLRTDGTGNLSGYYGGNSVPFLWEVDAGNPAKLNLTTLHDGAFQITTYAAEPGDNSGLWLCLTTPQGLLWMY